MPGVCCNMALTATDKQKIRALVSEQIQEIHRLISQEMQETIIPQLKEMAHFSSASSVHPASLPTLPDGPTEIKLTFLYREMSLRFDNLLQVMELDRKHTDKRFEEIEKRFKIIYWILGLMFTAGGLLFLFPIDWCAFCGRFNGWAVSISV